MSEYVRKTKQSWCGKCGMKIVYCSFFDETPVQLYPEGWVHETSLRVECSLRQPVADPRHNEVEDIDITEEVIW